MSDELPTPADRQTSLKRCKGLVQLIGKIYINSTSKSTKDATAVLKPTLFQGKDGDTMCFSDDSEEMDIIDLDSIKVVEPAPSTPAEMADADEEDWEPESEQPALEEPDQESEDELDQQEPTLEVLEHDSEQNNYEIASNCDRSSDSEEAVRRITKHKPSNKCIESSSDEEDDVELLVEDSCNAAPTSRRLVDSSSEEEDVAIPDEVDSQSEVCHSQVSEIADIDDMEFTQKAPTRTALNIESIFDEEETPVESDIEPRNMFIDDEADVESDVSQHSQEGSGETKDDGDLSGFVDDTEPADAVAQSRAQYRVLDGKHTNDNLTNDMIHKRYLNESDSDSGDEKVDLLTKRRRVVNNDDEVGDKLRLALSDRYNAGSVLEEHSDEDDQENSSSNNLRRKAMAVVRSYESRSKTMQVEGTLKPSMTPGETGFSSSRVEAIRKTKGTTDVLKNNNGSFLRKPQKEITRIFKAAEKSVSTSGSSDAGWVFRRQSHKSKTAVCLTLYYYSLTYL